MGRAGPCLCLIGCHRSAKLGGERDVWFPDAGSGGGTRWKQGGDGRHIEKWCFGASANHRILPSPLAHEGKETFQLGPALARLEKPRLASQSPSVGLGTRQVHDPAAELNGAQEARGIFDRGRTEQQSACRAIHGSPVQHQQSMIGPGVGRKRVRSRTTQVRGPERTSSSNGR